MQPGAACGQWLAVDPINSVHSPCFALLCSTKGRVPMCFRLSVVTCVLRVFLEGLEIDGLEEGQIQLSFCLMSLTVFHS